MNTLQHAFASQRLKDRGDDSFYHLRGCNLNERACEGTACFVARNSLEEMQPQHDANSPRVYCFGRCYEAPAIGLSNTRPHIEAVSRKAIVLERIGQGKVRALDEYRNAGGYRALNKALAVTPDNILDIVETSGLRGRGGAGFFTGRKWRMAAKEASSIKYVVANADEGDSGAYIDRFLMEDDPFALIEGMTLAAYATGAESGWIYLRREYPYAKDILEKALAEARSAGFLGMGILGGQFNFDIQVFVGQGSYICGEETALFRSIEGVRPEVTARPPFATKEGLFRQPTVVNNVETLVTVPWIIANGAAAYQELGFSRSRGTKAISLNSLFNRPGLYEVEFGTSICHIVEEIGGGLRTGPAKGVIVGGPLAGIIPPHLFDTPFGFEELRSIGAGIGHGGVIAFDERTSIAALIRHVFSFGAYEACGKCVPCRLGSKRIEDIFNEITTDHRATVTEESEWRDIVSALKWASLCGHGIGLGEFAESALRYYAEELAACFA